MCSMQEHCTGQCMAAMPKVAPVWNKLHFRSISNKLGRPAGRLRTRCRRNGTAHHPLLSGGGYRAFSGLIWNLTACMTGSSIFHTVYWRSRLSSYYKAAATCPCLRVRRHHQAAALQAGAYCVSRFWAGTCLHWVGILPCACVYIQGHRER